MMFFDPVTWSNELVISEMKLLLLANESNNNLIIFANDSSVSQIKYIRISKTNSTKIHFYCIHCKGKSANNILNISANTEKTDTDKNPFECELIQEL